MSSNTRCVVEVDRESCENEKSSARVMGLKLRNYLKENTNHYPIILVGYIDEKWTIKAYVCT